MWNVFLVMMNVVFSIMAGVMFAADRDWETG